MKKAGRPRMHKTPDDMRKVIDDYHAECVAEEKPFTITGLVLALGYSSKEGFYKAGRREEAGWAEVVNYGRLLAEHSYEQGGAKGTIPPAIAIFALKQFDWTDKQQVEHSGRVDLANSILTARHRAATADDES